MNLNDEKLIEIFSKKIRNKIKINDEWRSRKATEEEYFYAYLIFMSNSTIAIKEIHKIAIDVDSKKYINSNKYKRNIIGDKIYDSENIKNKCYNNGLVPIVDYNKRNTKDPIKLKNKKLNDHKLSIYNRRKIA